MENRVIVGRVGGLWWEKREGKGWVMGVKRGTVMVGKGGELRVGEGKVYGV